ncbi:MAG TPA: DUF4010 domain-containing protein [Steroidobacteraceae bacterium]|nr:DUF4010 domain-containing protein [Steroidobacteraceae bacterium]
MFTPGNWTMPAEATAILVALGAGLLIGVERERRKGDDAGRAAAGVRTFAMTSLLGVLTALAGSPVLLGATALGVVLLTAFSYFKSSSPDPGLTTEIALLATFITGVVAATRPVLAAAAGVLIVVLLVARTALHGFARRELSEQELRDAVLLAAAALLVLPILPDHAIDPWQVVNPRLIWKLTVLIMLVDAAGYVAQRLVGPRAGLPISGLLGGLVSSTAVVATMGRRSLDDPAVLPAAVAGAALSQVATVVQLALVLAVSDSALLGELRWPLLASGLAMVAYGFAMFRSSKSLAEAAPVAGRAFRVRTALLFAGAFCGVALLVAWLQDSFGPAWALAGVVAGGFADAHSTSASVGTLTSQGQMARDVGAIAVGLVVTTNTLSKLAFARAGGTAYFWRLAPGLVLLIASFWAAWWLVPR